MGEVRCVRRDAQDDAVAVLHLKGQGLSKDAVLDRYSESASAKRVTRIDDSNSRDVLLTVHAARGIKKIPPSTGLVALTVSVIGRDPLSGHLFVFRNRRGDRINILWWHRGGYVIWMKRLERGVFRFPAPLDHRVEVTPAELTAILGGIDLSRARRKRPFVPASPTLSSSTTNPIIH
jgi:transposase